MAMRIVCSARGGDPGRDMGRSVPSARPHKTCFLHQSCEDLRAAWHDDDPAVQGTAMMGERRCSRRGGQGGHSGRKAMIAVLAVVLTALSVSPEADADGDAVTQDQAWYILPPGNFGGLPPSDDSTDQLAMYDALTPLRGDVTQADIRRNFLPENFAPVGATREEPTGRPGLKILVRRVRHRARHRQDPGRRRLRRRLGHGPRPQPPDRAGPGPGAGGGRRRARNRRVLARDEWPAVRAERAGRGAGHRAEGPHRAHLRREGPRDPGRRSGRTPTVSTPTGAANGIDQPAGHRQRRDRGDRLHRVDLRRRRWWRGDERRPAGQAPAGARARSRGQQGRGTT